MLDTRPQIMCTLQLELKNMISNFLKRTKGLIILMIISSVPLYYVFLSIYGLTGYFSFPLYPNERIIVYTVTAVIIGFISGLIFSYCFQSKSLFALINISIIYLWHPTVKFIYYELYEAILGLILAWLTMVIFISIFKKRRQQVRPSC